MFKSVSLVLRNGTIRADSQKWHYPCVERMECEVKENFKNLNVL